MTDTTIELELETILRMQRHGWAEKTEAGWRCTEVFDAVIERYVEIMDATDGAAEVMHATLRHLNDTMGEENPEDW